MTQIFYGIAAACWLVTFIICVMGTVEFSFDEYTSTSWKIYWPSFALASLGIFGAYVWLFVHTA